LIGVLGAKWWHVAIETQVGNGESAAKREPIDGYVPARVFGRELPEPEPTPVDERGEAAPRHPTAGDVFVARGSIESRHPGQLSILHGDVVRFQSEIGLMWWQVTVVETAVFGDDSRVGQTGGAPRRLFCVRGAGRPLATSQSQGATSLLQGATSAAAAGTGGHLAPVTDGETRL
jgi:hypothetical protein